jgi:hypothetical protein
MKKIKKFVKSAKKKKKAMTLRLTQACTEQVNNSSSDILFSAYDIDYLSQNDLSI